MPNSFFQFKQFIIQQDRCAMKVTTDSCLFGAWVANNMQLIPSKYHVLDIGTGTGLLSLMSAQNNDVFIDAIEINKEASEQAKENVAASPWQDKISVINGDVLQWVTDKKYDCIICNPPFYETELKSPNHIKNIAHHDEGLKLEALLGFIKNHLMETGVFYLLLPAKRKAESESLLDEYNFYLHSQVNVSQTLTHQPFRVMITAGNKKEGLTTKGMSVKDGDDDYTPEFASLLTDYYLHL